MTETLPEGWTSTSLGGVCAEKVGQGLPGNQPVPYIDISSIDRSTKRIGATKSVTVRNSPTRARQWVHTGDVLVSMTRPNLNAVAQIGPDLHGAVASTGFDVLRPMGVVPGWVFYRVRTNEFVADVCAGLQGVVYPAIRPHDVRRHILPLSPLEEQQRIVEAIESYFTRLDDAVATLERVERDLKRYRASVLQAAVEGRLVPTEAELARAEGRDYEPASVLLERILAERRRRWEEAELAKMKAKGEPPKDEKWKARYQPPIAANAAGLQGLPDGWCWATIDQLAFVGTGATPKRGEPRFWSGGGVPWVTSAVVNAPLVQAPSEFVTQVALEETNLTLYPPGTLLVAMYGEGKTRGRATVLAIESTTNQALAALELPKTSGRVRDWLVRFLEHNYLELRRAASGGVQPNLNLGIVRAVHVPLPPLAEQGRICQETDKSLSIALAVDDALRSTARRASRLRQSILKWAFEGRLVDQDPADEPAFALLERIKAEREAEGGRPGGRGKRARRQRSSAEPAA